MGPFVLRCGWCGLVYPASCATSDLSLSRGGRGVMIFVMLIAVVDLVTNTFDFILCHGTVSMRRGRIPCWGTSDSMLRRFDIINFALNWFEWLSLRSGPALC
eukprot:PhM_4_TR14106/c0_g1_i2/m.95414